MIIKENGISYELNQKDFTAQVTSSPEAKGNIFIPRSINYQSREYIIVSIKEKSFKNKPICSIKFPNDSEIRKISRKSFSLSSLESLTIPSSLENLEEGWCKSTPYLNQICLSPNNKFYKYLDGNQKIIVGKSNPNNKYYDVLTFACRDIQKLTIPRTIRQLASYSLSECQIQDIQYEENSQLTVINKKVFHQSTITRIFIPASVTELKDGWLGEIWSNISITISSENLNYKNFEDKMIVGKSNPANDEFDSLIFVNCDVSELTVPSSIKYITSYSLCHSKLNVIEFSEDSELLSIGRNAFEGTAIQSISIPPHVKTIGRGAFQNCFELTTITFPENSELLSICKKAFKATSITSIAIKSNLVELEEGWCLDTPELKTVSISPLNKNFAYLDEYEEMIVTKSNLESDVFDVLVFACRDIEIAFIPPSIKKISSNAFAGCVYLKHVDFLYGSELETIGENAFCRCSIESIQIPATVNYLGPESFSDCSNLVIATFCEDSQLKSFLSGTFFNTSINEIFIPASIEELDDMCFSGMNFLKEITISDKNKHFTFLDDEKKVVAAKSDPSNEYYDVIVYAIRNIRKVVIPSFIRSIRPYAFSDCIKLNSIEFSEGSQLQSIGSSAFNMASFDEIVIPSHVNFIGEYAFNLCKNLKKIEFEKNSELIEFNCNLFNESAVESISFPDNLQRLSNGWCFKTSYLNNIYLSPENKNFVFLDESKKILLGKCDMKNDVYDKIVFVCRDVKEVSIPPYITNIGSSSFLGEDLSLFSLVSNQSLLLVSIPNVKNFSVSKYSFTYVQKDFALFINAGTHINLCQ